MRLFELNTNPQPGGGMCVLCGGSVRFVVDTDVEPLLTRAEWEASAVSRFGVFPDGTHTLPNPTGLEPGTYVVVNVEEDS